MLGKIPECLLTIVQEGKTRRYHFLLLTSLVPSQVHLMHPISTVACSTPLCPRRERSSTTQHSRVSNTWITCRHTQHLQAQAWKLHMIITSHHTSVRECLMLDRDIYYRLHVVRRVSRLPRHPQYRATQRRVRAVANWKVWTPGREVTAIVRIIDTLMKTT